MGGGGGVASTDGAYHVLSAVMFRHETMRWIWGGGGGGGGGGRQVGNRPRRLNVRIGLMCMLTVS